MPRVFNRIEFLYHTPTRDQIDERFSRPQSAEGCTFTATQQLKSELPVEFDGTDHVINSQCHRSDMLDHSDRPLFVMP
jgi:hypothetical protein